MTGIDRIVAETAGKLGIKIAFYKKETELGDAAKRKLSASGKYTLFRFFFKGEAYIGGLEGTGKTEKNYALLLPPFFESFGVTSGEISKSEFLKRILLGESSSSDVYKYMLKYGVREAPCFVIAFRVPKMMEETLSLITQYGGNGSDTAIRLDEQNCVLLKFLGEEEDEYRSQTDYADFLAQSLKEELGVEVTAGVGGAVSGLKEISSSYNQAASALRYADVFAGGEGVHSYKEFILVKMLEDVSELKLSEYFADLTDENSKEIFGDEEMLATAEEFLQSSLNVSETSRKLYMHRNTLLYRLDKIEKATGLNVREFPDAVTFRVLTILYKLLKK